MTRMPWQAGAALDIPSFASQPVERQARAFVLVMRMTAIAIAGAAVAINTLTADDGIRDDAWKGLLLFGALSAAYVLVGRLGTWRAAAIVSAYADTIALVLYLQSAEFPTQAAAAAVLPIMVMAYFGGPRSAAALSLAAAAAIALMLSRTETARAQPTVPTISSIVLLTGAVTAMLAARLRMAESALRRELHVDDAALRIIHALRGGYGESITHAMRAAACELGSAAGADACALVSSWIAAPTGRPRADPTATRKMLWRAEDAPSSRRVSDVELREEAERVLRGGEPRDAAGPRELMSMPMHVGDEPVGVVVLASVPDERETHQDARRLLELVAPQVATALMQATVLADQAAALAKLEQVDRIRQELIANVSHELRTPLTTTLGFLETLLRPDLQLEAAERDQLLLHARDGARRLLALVEDLLTLGTMRSERIELHRQPVPVGELVGGAITGLEPPQGRELEVDPGDPRVRASVDPPRMMQVIANLVVNAYHHGSGTVRVCCFARGDRVLIDVLDEGPGVAPEHVSELFLPFARFSDRSDSTGLGLAICRTIVEAHGGTITYGRTSTDSTRFRVMVPRGCEDATD